MHEFLSCAHIFYVILFDSPKINFGSIGNPSENQASFGSHGSWFISGSRAHRKSPLLRPTAEPLEDRSFFQLFLINANTHNLNILLSSKPNENKNIHKPKTINPHKNQIFKAKEKNTQKEESRSTTTKEIYT